MRPTYKRAHNNLGLCFHERRDYALAAASFAEAVRLNPAYATAYNNLGTALQAQGFLDEAAAHFKRALAARPDYPEAHFNTGTALEARGDLAGAAASFREAIAIRPTYARALLHLGRAPRAVPARPRRPRLLRSCRSTRTSVCRDAARLGDLLVLKRDWPAALVALEKAAEKLDPRVPMPSPASSGRGSRSAIGAIIKPASSGCGPTRKTGSPKGSRPASYRSRHSPSLGRDSACWPSPAVSAMPGCSRIGSSGSPVDDSRPATLTSGCRLRVGYLSADFCDHAISHLICGLFGRHDRQNFEIFAYSFGPISDSPFRRRIMAECDHFVDVAALSYPDSPVRSLRTEFTSWLT